MTTVVYDISTGAIMRTYEGEETLPTQEGVGSLPLSPEQIHVLAQQGALFLELNCYVDTSTDPPTVAMRIPAEIRTSKDSVCCDGEDSILVWVRSAKRPIATTLFIDGIDYGDAPVSCPAEGVSLTFHNESGGYIDIAERKYIAESVHPYVHKEASDGTGP